MRKIVFLIAVCAFFVGSAMAQGQKLNLETVNQMGRNGERYTAVEPFQVQDWSVFGDQPRYDPAHPEMLDGYQRTTAGERGFSLVNNEMGNNQAPLVRLNPNEVVLCSGDNCYLDNCTWLIGGKRVEFKNRIKPVSPPEQFETPPPAYEPPSIQSYGVPDWQPKTSPPPTTPGIITASLRTEVTIPRLDWCDTDRDGWRPDRMLMGMIQKVRCEPGAMILDTTVSYGLARAFPRIPRPNTPVKTILPPEKLPIHTISPP